MWCHRIDPARARIESIPTPESGRRYQDLVLHDGEPRGKRRLGEREVSVFDELALLDPSPFKTWCIDVVAPDEKDLEALFRKLAECTDAALEDWSESLEILCKSCSEGVPHEHVPPSAKAWHSARRIGVAARDEGVFRHVVAWAGERAGCHASEPALLLA